MVQVYRNSLLKIAWLVYGFAVAMHSGALPVEARIGGLKLNISAILIVPIVSEGNENSITCAKNHFCDPGPNWKIVHVMILMLP